MELAIRQRSADLAQVSQLVLSDLGATLQILRHAGRENSRKTARIVGMDLPNRYKLLKFYDKDCVAVSLSDGWPVV